jgi:DNA polymerase-1
MGKLLAIDGLNIVRRVYEANAETDAAAKAELALRHALQSFKKLLAVHQPSHALVAFDHGDASWRNDLHPAYRVHRTPVPAELQAGLAAFEEELATLGLKTVAVDKAEAADVIATVTLRWLHEQRGEAIVASTSHALHGLVAHGALLWDHFKAEWHDRAWVEQKFGVPPQRLPDLLALEGDAAKHIPGVSKVGAKTGARLLQTYGDLEQVMAGAGILKNPLGERLRKERDALDLSRRLVALKSDVRLGVTWKMLEVDAAHG